MKDVLVKRILIALVPSLVLALFFFILIGFSRGMDAIATTKGIWYLIGFISFELLLVFAENGDLIVSRSMKYLAYLCWLAPVFALLYTIVSASSVVKKTNDAASNAGALIGVGIGGFAIVFITFIVGGLLGLVLFLIGNSVYKNRKEKLIQSRKKMSESNIPESPQA